MSRLESPLHLSPLRTVTTAVPKGKISRSLRPLRAHRLKPAARRRRNLGSA
jgi:hypothetical protein